MGFSNYTNNSFMPYSTMAQAFNLAAGGSSNPAITQGQLYNSFMQGQQQFATQNQSMRHLMQAGNLTPELQSGLNGSVMQLQNSIQNTSNLLSATDRIGQNFSRIAAFDPYAAPNGKISRNAMQMFENLDGQPGFSAQDVAMLPPGYPMMGQQQPSTPSWSSNPYGGGGGSMMMSSGSYGSNSGLMTNANYWGGC